MRRSSETFIQYVIRPIDGNYRVTTHVGGSRVPFTGGAETLVVSSVPGCEAGATVSTDGGAAFSGPIARFFGTKVFDCGASGTFTLAYNEHTFACMPTDSGAWKIVGGTGSHAGMTGQGRLTGTFYGPEVVDCGPAEGVLDSHTGSLKLAGT